MYVKLMKLKEGSVDEQFGNNIRIQIRSWTSVLVVATFIHGNMSADTDGGTTIGHAPTKVIN